MKVFVSKKSKPLLNKIVFAVGGGKILDEAKIYAKKNKKICIAIPTTGSGASETSHAVIWNKKKTNIKTSRPVTLLGNPFKIKLDKETRHNSTCDILGHIIDYLHVCSDNELIEVGRYAGQLIEKHPTNLTHPASYPLTLKGIPHGEAVGMVLIESLKKMLNL